MNHTIQHYVKEKWLRKTGVLSIIFIGILFLTIVPIMSFASGTTGEGPSIGNIRIEFILFALVLIGVAVFHDHTFWVAVIGLTVILIYKFIFTTHFNFIEHFTGTTPFIEQLIDKETRTGEWGILLNLLGLLLGFAILAKLFEESGVPDILPNYLPDDWKGPFVLLIFVFILSSFLDNIAAALIGGTIAIVVFNKRVHIGYLAAIVAASNAGGAGSVVGDTTTTMMWIAGVSPLDVLHGFIASASAFIFFAWFASFQQDKFQRIQKDAPVGAKVDWGKVAVVGLILVFAILANYFYDMPALGVWIALLIGAIFKKIPFYETKHAIKGTIFLLCLVTSASLMPVETLPDASWMSAFILGFISSVFDNIPLTKICIDQGHYDWGVLAYTVGFGGSMVWFGSSAGVAITNKFPQGRNVMLWLRKGWHVAIGYIVGFFAIIILWGWHPESNRIHKEPAINCPVENCHVKLKAKADSLIIKMNTEQTDE